MGFLLIIAGLLVYFASQREHPNATAIGVFNFFLGWTFIGWVVALVWSLGNTKAKRVTVENMNQNKAEDNLDKLLKLKKLLDEGVISQEEFDLKKQKLLNLEK